MHKQNIQYVTWEHVVCRKTKGMEGRECQGVRGVLECYFKCGCREGPTGKVTFEDSTFPSPPPLPQPEPPPSFVWATSQPPPWHSPAHNPSVASHCCWMKIQRAYQALQDLVLPCLSNFIWNQSPQLQSQRRSGNFQIMPSSFMAALPEQVPLKVMNITWSFSSF